MANVKDFDPWLISKSPLSCLNLPGASITAECHHACLKAGGFCHDFSALPQCSNLYRVSVSHFQQNFMCKNMWQARAVHSPYCQPLSSVKIIGKKFRHFLPVGSSLLNFFSGSNFVEIHTALQFLEFLNNYGKSLLRHACY